jgi:hypothetical protein
LVGPTLNVRPAGVVCTTTWNGFWTKFAISVIGPFVVMIRGLVVPLNDPVPDPVQLEKLNPAFGMPVMDTGLAASYQPVGGVAVPPGLAVMVRRYCVTNVAVNVVADVGATICARVPASFHDVQRYRVPVVPAAWMLSDVIECADPVVQLNVWGLV